MYCTYLFSTQQVWLRTEYLLLLKTYTTLEMAERADHNTILKTCRLLNLTILFPNLRDSSLQVSQ